MGCGICGFVGFSDHQLLRAMCSSLRHRGPDDTDLFEDEMVGLGADRLRVIDLTRGDQPIHNEDGTVWVVFNGEIYNFAELRSELEAAGHRFYTDTDTECIVHGYEAWGVQVLERLRGMFAFALWDGEKRRLFLARDRFGKKPLYYSLHEGSLLFASEMKAILLHEGVVREIDFEALDLFLSFLYVPSPLSIFKSVRKLPPAHYALFSGGSLTLREYWRPSFARGPPTDEAEAEAQVFRLLEDSVRVRLRSDVPLGGFLSGGIDSSTVVSLMTRMTDEPVKTISIGFEEGQSELKFARQVAEWLDTDHVEHVVAPSAFEDLPLLVRHFDEPFADSSMLPTYYLSKVARERVTVALSGDGGDELFMGYEFLTDPAGYSAYSRIPPGLRHPAMRILASLPTEWRARRLAKNAEEKGYGSQPPSLRYAMRMATVGAETLGSLYSRGFVEARHPSNTYSYLAGLFGQSGSSDLLDSADYATIRSYLAEGILTKVDRMSMAVSLEVRCPLLDQVLAERVFALPSALKLRRGQTKLLLKRIAVRERLVPREIVTRGKHGFGAPLESWMGRDWRELSSNTLEPLVTGGSGSFFDPAEVRKYLSDPYLYSNRLLALVVYRLWQDAYLGEGASPS
jgi:asparagine synthase (glutamine-hydrolysing)